MNYTCTKCGKSCSLFEEINVEPASRDRLHSLPFQPLLPEPVRDLSPLVKSPLDGKKDILRKHCGRCVFQQEDNLCAIHSRFGFDAKPQTCGDFPYRYVDTPAGVFVGLSFVCTAVQQNHGTPLAEQAADLAARLPTANSSFAAAGPFQLTNRHGISFDAYQLLEEDLANILRSPALSFSRRLLVQSVYLDLFEAFLREIRSDLPLTNPATAAEPGRFTADTVRPDTSAVLALRSYLTDHPEKLYRIQARFRASASLQRAFLGLITAFRQNLYIKAKNPTRLGTMLRIVHHYATHAFGLGSVDLEALEGRFHYADFGRLHFPEDDPAVEQFLQRYFSHALFRKDLLMGRTIWLAHRFMLMHYALIRWHAVGIAALGGKAAIGIEEVREAVSHVERHYVLHTPFDRLFEDLPSLGMVLGSIVRKPAYAASMVMAKI
jgi:Fe-S-cluster containining protein